MFDLRHLPNPIPDEKLVYFLRRHPFTLISLGAGYIAAFVVPILLGIYFFYTQPEWLSGPWGTVLFLGLSIFFLYSWLFLFQSFVDYYLDIWIVTTKRIINIEQTGLFGRTVSELRLYRIQDVTATVKGFFETFFNYGEVEIQTAAETVRFNFEQVSHPNAVAKTILELSETDRRGHLDEAVEDFALADPHHQKKA